MTSLVLKAFLIAGTVGLFVWADMLPDDADSEPVGWDLLLVALIGAALALLLLRLMRRTRPLMIPYVVRRVRRLRGDGPIVEAVAGVLAILAVLGFLLALVMLLVLAIAAALWHGGIPEALVLGPFCVAVGARVVLWAMGRGEFPDGDGI
jgi:hypothetical protein